MWYGVGVDLGTSFTSVAVSGPDGTRMVPMGPDVVVPSVACPAPDGTLLTGIRALAADDPARVARNFKRRLGDPTPLVLGGSAYSAAVLMAAQLRDVLACVARSVGDAPKSIVLTCPAIWGPYRREHFTEVLRLADVSTFHLVTEPEAAATHYCGERRLGDGEVVAVYDLGGGTFDTTVLRMRAGGMEILGTPEGIEHMGGIDFDETLRAHLDDRLDGAVSALDPADPAAAEALAGIRAMCVRAKEELSIEPDVRLSVPLPAGPRQVLVTRLELNEMIRPSVRLTIDALRRTVSSAGLRAEDLSAVLLAGGSSRIPLVAQLVSQQLGKPVRVTLHPKFTVALGAARIAARLGPVARPAPMLATVAASAPAAVRSTVRAGVPATVPATVLTTPGNSGPEPAGSVRVAEVTGGFPVPRRWAFPRGRATWLVTTIVTVLVVVISTVTALLITSGGGQAQQGGQTGRTTSRPANTPTAPPAELPPLRLYNGSAVGPFVGFVASAVNWAAPAEITAAGATQPSITAKPDGPDGLRVTWDGDEPAQVYLQSPARTRDLSSYADADGALVFDVVVHRPPADSAAIELHCVHPCGAGLAAETLFQRLPLETRSTVRVRLSCFTAAGLNAKEVNTPWLVYSETPFDATFSNIRWEQHAGTDAPNTTCEKLE